MKVQYIIKKQAMGLRVSLEDETQGIDIAEFGQTAYTFDQQLNSEGVRLKKLSLKIDTLKLEN